MRPMEFFNLTGLFYVRGDACSLESLEAVSIKLVSF